MTCLTTQPLAIRLAASSILRQSENSICSLAILFLERGGEEYNRRKAKKMTELFPPFPAAPITSEKYSALLLQVQQ